MMDPYIKPQFQALEDQRRQIIEAVAPLSDEQINRSVPGLQNTVGMLLKHIAGSERYWIGEVAGGRPAHRNRDAEFAPIPVTKAEALAAIEASAAVSREVIEGMTHQMLLEEVEVKRATGAMRETRAGAVLHASHHLAYHLGQLRSMARLISG